MLETILPIPYSQFLLTSSQFCGQFWSSWHGQTSSPKPNLQISLQLQHNCSFHFYLIIWSKNISFCLLSGLSEAAAAQSIFRDICLIFLRNFSLCWVKQRRNCINCEGLEKPLVRVQQCSHGYWDRYTTEAGIPWHLTALPGDLWFYISFS